MATNWDMYDTYNSLENNQEGKFRLRLKRCDGSSLKWNVQVTTEKQLHRKQFCVEVMLRSYHLNSHTMGFNQVYLIYEPLRYVN